MTEGKALLKVESFLNKTEYRDVYQYAHTVKYFEHTCSVEENFQVHPKMFEKLSPKMNNIFMKNIKANFYFKNMWSPTKLLRSYLVRFDPNVNNFDDDLLLSLDVHYDGGTDQNIVTFIYSFYDDNSQEDIHDIDFKNKLVYSITGDGDINNYYADTASIPYDNNTLYSLPGSVVQNGAANVPLNRYHYCVVLLIESECSTDQLLHRWHRDISNPVICPYCAFLSRSHTELSYHVHSAHQRKYTNNGKTLKNDSKLKKLLQNRVAPKDIEEEEPDKKRIRKESKPTSSSSSHKVFSQSSSGTSSLQPTKASPSNDFELIQFSNLSMNLTPTDDNGVLNLTEIDYHAAIASPLEPLSPSGGASPQLEVQEVSKISQEVVLIID